jgi:hypothetical protein
MTVKQLIEKLQTLPPETPVVSYYPLGDCEDEPTPIIWFDSPTEVDGGRIGLLDELGRLVI